MSTEPIRMLFLGNSEGYSAAFARRLVDRSNDPSDRVDLVAIVCPRRFAALDSGRSFEIKRWISRQLGRLGPRFKAAMLRERGGVYEAIQQCASAGDVPVHWPKSLDDVLDTVEALSADVCIVAGLNKILRPHVLDRFPPVYNIHPSRLPEYRGATPEFWQLADGAERGGVTLHRIDAGVDTGPIVLQRETDIDRWIDAADLGVLTVSIGLAMLDEFVDGFPEITGRTIDQNVTGSYRPLPTSADQIAPFGEGASIVFDRARAFGWSSPLVVHVDRRAWSENGALLAVSPTSSTIELHLFDPTPIADETHDPPGTIHRNSSGGAVLVCNPGVILFRRARPAAS